MSTSVRTRSRSRSLGPNRGETNESDDEQQLLISSSQTREGSVSPTLHQQQLASPLIKRISFAGEELDAEAAIDEVRQAIEDDKSQLQSLNQRLARFTRHTSNLQEDGKNWQQRFDELNTTYQNDMEQTRVETMNQFKAMHKTHNNLADKLSTMHISLEKALAEKQSLNSKNQTLTVQVETIRKELTITKNKLATLADEYNTLIKEYSSGSSAPSSILNLASVDDFVLNSSGKTQTEIINELLTALQESKKEIQRNGLLLEQNDEVITSKNKKILYLEEQIRRFNSEYKVLLELITHYEDILYQNGFISLYSEYNLANNKDKKFADDSNPLDGDEDAQKQPVKTTKKGGKKPMAKKKTTPKPATPTKAAKDSKKKSAPKKSVKKTHGKKDSMGDESEDVHADSDVDEDDIDEDVSENEETLDEQDGDAEDEDYTFDEYEEDDVDTIKQQYEHELMALEEHYIVEQKNLTSKYKDEIYGYKAQIAELQREIHQLQTSSLELTQQSIQAANQLTMMESRLTTLKNQYNMLNTQYNTTIADLSEVSEKYEQKCEEFEVLLSIKVQLIEQLQKYERILGGEERRLGLDQVYASLPQDIKDDTTNQLIISADSIPDFDEIVQKQNQKLGIQGFYATEEEQAGRDTVLYDHQVFLASIHNQIRGNMKSVQRSTDLFLLSGAESKQETITEIDPASNTTITTTTVTTTEKIPIQQYEHQNKSSQSASWLSGILNIFNANSATTPLPASVAAVPANKKRALVEEAEQGDTIQRNNKKAKAKDFVGNYIADDLFDDVDQPVAKDNAVDDTTDEDDIIPAVLVTYPNRPSRKPELKEAVPTQLIEDGDDVLEETQLDENVQEQDEMTDDVAMNPFSKISRNVQEEAAATVPLTREERRQQRAKRQQGQYELEQKHLEQDEKVSKTTLVTNTSVLMSGVDELGQYIKIINGGTDQINLENWSLFTHGRQFKFIFPEGAILPAASSFILRTLTDEDSDNTFEPDDDNVITIYVKHALWSSSDDKCSLYNQKGKEKASVRISHADAFPQVEQPSGCSMM